MMQDYDASLSSRRQRRVCVDGRQRRSFTDVPGHESAEEAICTYLEQRDLGRAIIGCEENTALCLPCTPQFIRNFDRLNGRGFA